MSTVEESVAALSDGYQAIPLRLTPERYEVASQILREICRFETLFTDYERPACSAEGAACLECADCMQRKHSVVRTLLDPYARVWEVWTTSASNPTLVGLLYLTRIIAGGDALAHYVFFDNDLRSKTELIEEMIAWCFSDHPEDGWIALRRLTVEVPAYAHALARHASRALHFGGPFTHGEGRKALAVEGVRRSAIVWRNAPHDILILGRLNG